MIRFFQARFIAFKACKRIPLAEELLEPVVILAKQMRADQQSDLKGFHPIPLLHRHLTGSLEAELGRPPHGRRTVATDWTAYQEEDDAADSWEQAARLIHLTLASVPRGKAPMRSPETERKSRFPPTGYGKAENVWVREESERLWKEISQGDYKSRWMRTNSNSLNDADALNDAGALLSANPQLHPFIKDWIMEQIAIIVNATK